MTEQGETESLRKDKEGARSTHESCHIQIKKKRESERTRIYHLHLSTTTPTSTSSIRGNSMYLYVDEPCVSKPHTLLMLYIYIQYSISI